MKKLIIIFILGIFTNIIYAQNVSVEFSIEWQNELSYSIKELEKTDIKPAYLILKYRNISDKPLYFSKITEGIFDLPDLLLGRAVYRFDNMPFTYYQNDTCKPYFTVGFRPNSYYYSWFSWNFRKDTICGERFVFFEYSMLDEKGNLPEPIVVENKTDGLFDNLNNIYTDIYNRFYPEFIDEKNNFYEEDITEYNILKKFRDRFVFLKPKETFVAKFNLIGFQLVGGNFTFQLDSVKSLNYVNVELPKEDKYAKSEYKQKKLPQKVGEYELFTGDFVSNKTSVYFEGVKRKE